MKTYNVQAYFNNITLQIKAKNKNEARKKVYEKLKKKTALSVVDKTSLYLDEIDDYYT